MRTTSTTGRRWAATVGAASLAMSLALPGLALAAPDQGPGNAGNAPGQEKHDDEDSSPGNSGKAPGQQDEQLRNSGDNASENKGQNQGENPGKGCGKPEVTGENPGQGNAGEGQADRGNVCDQTSTDDQTRAGDETSDTEVPAGDKAPDETIEHVAEEGVKDVEAPDSCRELVTYTATHTDGDARAVALTAQAIENGTEGWSLVAWEAADDTRISSVVVQSATGETKELDGDVNTGFAENVTGLVFCGEREVAEDDTAGTGVDTDVDTDEDTLLIAPTEETNRGLGGTPGSNDHRPTETERGAGNDTTDVLGVQITAVEANSNGTSTAGNAVAVATASAATNDTEPADGDTEVLGVQLARTGLDTAALAVTGLLALLSGAALLLVTRRRGQIAGQA